MKYIVTSEEMKRYDAYTINTLGISGEVLMERAALASVHVIKSYCLEKNMDINRQRILVVAGTGNNGGDGLAVARLLIDDGCEVSVAFIGEKGKQTAQTRSQVDTLSKYGYLFSDIFPENEYDIIVDALFGVGISREVTGIYARTIEKINASKAVVFSLDMPSGIDTDTGKVWGTAVKADVTVTFAYTKRGLLFYPGAEYAGKVICANIGITDRSFDNSAPEMFTFDEKPSLLLIKRNPNGNKGTFGKVLMLAGSKDMAGAAVLASMSCYRAGAGMVKVVTPEENRIIIQERIPEAMLLTYGDMDSDSADFMMRLKESFVWADLLVAGPGLGKSAMAKELLTAMIVSSDKTLLLDADALNLLAEDEELQAVLKENIANYKRNVILTPHIGELARLLKCDIPSIKDDLVDAAKEAAGKLGCIMVCKDARTVVCRKTGKIFLNTAGNSGMATAGSGDVLSGIIAALCCLDTDCFRQVATGVYMHALAGDIAAHKKSEEAVMASDIIEALPLLQNVKIEEI